MPNRRSLAMLVVLAFGTALAACGSDSPNTTASPAAAHAFVLDEWSVKAPTGEMAGGKVDVSVSNEGHETHELVIVRASDAASLPTKSDGSVDEDEIPESEKVGEIADLGAGETANDTFDLQAGNYLAFCNIVDDMGNNGMDMGRGGPMGSRMGMEHVHYQLGMVTHFTVT